MIDWARIPNQPQFDRVVEAFFVNEFAHLPAEAYVVNGRGGDGGIDIRIRTADKLIVVQLKFFPEGFSGGWAKTRRKQIRQSFDSALTHEPDEWWLVVPQTLTASERDFVLGLSHRKPPSEDAPIIVVFDRPLLDALAARHLSLVTYFQRDHLLEAAKVFNQEVALMAHADDLGTRLTALTQQADTLDPDWRLEVVSDGQTTGTTIVAKHPHAAERSPITLTLRASFGPEHTDLRRRFERVISWGTPDSLELPPAVVENVSVRGPAVFSKSDDHAQVKLVTESIDTDTHTCALVFYEGTRRVGSFAGTTSWLGSATAGASVRAEFNNSIRFEFLLPFDRTAAVSMDLHVSFRGRQPVDVLRGLALLDQLESGASMALEIDGVQMARLRGSADRSLYERMGDFAAGFDEFRGYVEDLDVVQRLTSTYFPLPALVADDDRLWLRCMRLLLEGNCIVSPTHDGFTQVMDNPRADQVRDLLTDEPFSLAANLPELEIEAFGHTFNLGPARFYAPKMEVADKDTLLEALNDGIAHGKTLTLRACDGYGIWLYLPPLLEPEARTLRPVGLGLDGIPNAPDVGRALTT